MMAYRTTRDGSRSSSGGAAAARVDDAGAKRSRSGAWTSTSTAWLLAAGLLALGPALLLLRDGDGSSLGALFKGKARSNDSSINSNGGGGVKDADDDLAQLFSNLRPRPRLHADPLKTTRCEHNDGVRDAHGRQRPLVQYALMIDAGSTGSRIHVYKFNNCGPSPELETEVFDLVKGGLSAPAYSASAGLAADSLRPLLDLALRQVPKSLWSCTPISVKATAGLRLLGIGKAEQILQAVRKLLEEQYPFPIADTSGTKNGVEIMDGRDEGVFAFITVNYLLNRLGDSNAADSFGSDLTRKSRPQTAAVLDLGGGSTQIVFEPRFEGVSKAVREEASHVGMHPGEHVYELKNFGSHRHVLYQNSYLGYGLMQARTTVNALTLHAYLLSHPLGAPPRAAPSRRRRNSSSSSSSTTTTTAARSDAPRDEPELLPIPPWEGMTEENTHVPSPCYGPRGKREMVRVERVGALGSAASQSELDERGREGGSGGGGGGWMRRGRVSKAAPAAREASPKENASASRNVTFLGGGGGFAACRRFVEIMMDKDASCALPPCSFAGVYQPPLISTFQNAPILALSYFYDRLVPLLGTKHEYVHRHLVQIQPSVESAESTQKQQEPTVEEERSASFTLAALRTLAEKVCAGPVRRSNVSDADILSAYADFYDYEEGDEHEDCRTGAEARLAAIDASLWDWSPHFPPDTHPHAAAELFHRPESCLDLSYMYALLSHGYELPEDRVLVLAKKVGGVELGWCLGAQLAILEDEGLQCRARA
ncbi:Guanosine-diphosphatase [Tilletia horrida]|nr:Guanosine-diphosphatase [Tilletia horrida]